MILGRPPFSIPGHAVCGLLLPHTGLGNHFLLPSVRLTPPSAVGRAQHKATITLSPRPFPAHLIQHVVSVAVQHQRQAMGSNVLIHKVNGTL